MLAKTAMRMRRIVDLFIGVSRRLPTLPQSGNDSKISRSRRKPALCETSNPGRGDHDVVELPRPGRRRCWIPIVFERDPVDAIVLPRSYPVETGQACVGESVNPELEHT